jgi:aldehyde dehydrogenase (NAD+)
MVKYSSADFDTMRNYFFSGATVEYTFRKEQLQILKKGVQKYEQQIMDALFKDLHKSPEEAFTTEIGFVYSEISHTLKNLQKWMGRSSVSTPLFLLPSSSSIIRDPRGVCLIIAPWNYPFQLLIAPLIGAIAGGNCAVLKPSEMAANTSLVIHEMIAEFFDNKFISVVEGDGAVVVTALMNEHRFDHVFFTGSIPVGTEIAKMAAEKLVPVTLELGGKSPCIIDEDADLKVAAKRITWGKFTNAGQTCVAPDYLLVHEKNKDKVVNEMQQSIDRFYGKEPIKSADYGRIINHKRIDKLRSYLNQGEVISGGKIQEEELYFSPTLMEHIVPEAPMMKEEIFGPILPIITFKERGEALAIIQKNSHPLSLYYFGNDKRNEDYFINNVQFGGGCINNTLVHLANADLPFGGVGNSGTGAYHGKYSFETFTRAKAILKTATWIDPDVKYPPYKGKLKFLRWFFR